jgi:hypothetical protein
VIDPARFVAAHSRVDHVPVIEGKKHGVVRILWIERRRILRFLPGKVAADVFNDPGPFPNPPLRKNPSAMHTGFPNNNPVRRFVVPVSR